MTDLFTFHLVQMPVRTTVPLLRRAPQPDQVAGLRYAECLSLMRLGAPAVSAERLQLRRLAMFARWDNEAAIEKYLAGARPLFSRVWARMLGVETDQDHGAAVVSRTWRRLDQKYGLITRGKTGRRAVFTSLREDGSREDYTAPSGRDVANRYFQLPFEYWTDEQAWYRTLTLAAKAMLLVGSTLGPGFIMPGERVPEWYGISESSAQRGLAELREVGLLNLSISYKPTPLEKIPTTEVYNYTLVPPFGRTEKRRLRVVPKIASA